MPLPPFYPSLAAVQAHAAASAVVRIPISQRFVRSLNLATSVGVGVYEAIRQLDGAVLPEDEGADKGAEGEAGRSTGGQGEGPQPQLGQHQQRRQQGGEGGGRTWTVAEATLAAAGVC